MWMTGSVSQSSRPSRRSRRVQSKSNPSHPKVSNQSESFIDNSVGQIVHPIQSITHQGGLLGRGHGRDEGAGHGQAAEGQQGASPQHPSSLLKRTDPVDRVELLGGSIELSVDRLVGSVERPQQAGVG